MERDYDLFERSPTSVSQYTRRPARKAVLVGGHQRFAGTASDLARHSLNQRHQSNGQAREPALAQIFRLGCLRCHGGGGSGDDHHVLSYLRKSQPDFPHH